MNRPLSFDADLVPIDAGAFTKGCRLIAKTIRVRADAQWDDEDFTLKFLSFVEEFPEVNGRQFLWCCERWIQAQTGDFLRFPTWRQLMVPLYRTEQGLANRSWGFRDDLPNPLLPTAQQKALLPERGRSLLPAPDPTNSQAYAVVGGGAPQLPPAEPRGLSSKKLTTKEWREHIERCKAEAARARDAAQP